MPDTHYDLNSSGVGGWGGGFGGGFGSGFGGIAPFGLIGLLGGRGLFGEDGRRHDGGHDCGDAIWQAAVMSKLGTLEAGQPLATAAINANTTAGVTAVRDTIQNQSLGQLAAISQLALAGQQGFANLKDATQAQFGVTQANIGNLKDTVQVGIHAQGVNAMELANLINSTTCGIKQAINADGDMTRALINQIDRDRLRDELDELRHDHRTRGAEINMTQTVNTVQAQAQAQQQQQQQQQAIFDLSHRFSCFANRFDQLQSNRAANGAIQFGNGVLAQLPNQQQNQVGGGVGGF